MPQLARFLNLADFGSDGCAGLCIKVLSNAHGASERLVVSPAHAELGLLEMPGGQSGHPLSTHYRDQQAFWQEGLSAPFAPGETVHTWFFAAEH